jgi:hypothetical protein
VHRVFAGFSLVFAAFLAVTSLCAQTPGPDTVTFANGEKLAGHFDGLTNGAARFKSDQLGEITIDLSKLQELHSTERFALIRKGVKLHKKDTDGQVPRGTITISNKMVQVDPGSGQPVQTVALGDVDDIVEEATFLGAFRSPGIFHDWKGALTLGASLVEATQDSESLNTSVDLVRTMPPASQNWLPQSNRTIVAFSDSYGTVSQPNTPTVKTSIFHAGAERDEYFASSGVFGFGSAAFDHNFSQALDLQQVYGGGIGWSVIKKPKQELDLKASINYERQSFQVASQDHSLATSAFGETYTRTLAHGIGINEQLAASPAWTDLHAYSAYGSVGVVLPVYKRFGLSVNLIDSYLNDPPKGFKTNSVQFTTGISYTLP